MDPWRRNRECAAGWDLSFFVESHDMGRLFAQRNQILTPPRPKLRPLFRSREFSDHARGCLRLSQAMWKRQLWSIWSGKTLSGTSGNRLGATITWLWAWTKVPIRTLLPVVWLFLDLDYSSGAGQGPKFLFRFSWWDMCRCYKYDPWSCVYSMSRVLIVSTLPCLA